MNAGLTPLQCPLADTEKLTPHDFHLRFIGAQVARVQWEVKQLSRAAPHISCVGVNYVIETGTAGRSVRA
jgi:hypothetical protein